MNSAPIAILFAGALFTVLYVASWLRDEWRGTDRAPRPLRYEVDPADWSDIERIESAPVTPRPWWDVAL